MIEGSPSLVMSHGPGPDDYLKSFRLSIKNFIDNIIKGGKFTKS